MRRDPNSGVVVVVPDSHRFPEFGFPEDKAGVTISELGWGKWLTPAGVERRIAEVPAMTNHVWSVVFNVIRKRADIRPTSRSGRVLQFWFQGTFGL
jgi:hypothetical protein